MKIGLAGNFGFSVGLGHLYRLKGLYAELKTLTDVVFFSQSPEQSKLLKTVGIGHVDIKDFDCHRLIYDGRTKIDQLTPNLNAALEDSILIDRVENFDPKFGKSIVPSFYISSLNRKQLENNFSQYCIGLEYFFIRNSKMKKVKKPIVTFGGSDPNNLTQKIANILGDDAVYILGPLYGEKRKKELLLSVSAQNIINAPTDTYSYLAACPCVITALGTTLQEVELLQKPCFIIANYTADLEDYLAIKNCSSSPENFKGCVHFQDNFKEEIRGFVNNNNDVKSERIYDHKQHNAIAASLWIEFLR